MEASENNSSKIRWLKMTAMISKAKYTNNNPLFILGLWVISLNAEIGSETERDTN